MDYQHHQRKNARQRSALRRCGGAALRVAHPLSPPSPSQLRSLPSGKESLIMGVCMYLDGGSAYEGFCEAWAIFAVFGEHFLRRQVLR